MAPVHQVCRLGGAGALREHLLNPFGEAKKVRASPSGFLTIDHFGLRHTGLASLPRPLPCCGSGRVRPLRRGRGAPPLPPTGRWRRSPFWRHRRCIAAPRPRIRAFSPPSRLSRFADQCSHRARRLSMRAEAPADGLGPTTLGAGAVAALAASVADLPAARCGRFCTVRSSRLFSRA